MAESTSPGVNNTETLKRLRTGICIIGALCIVIALAHSIFMPSVLRYCEGVMAVRLTYLKSIGALDYEAVKAAGEYDFRNAWSLAEWVGDDGLHTANLASNTTTATFALIGIACLLLAWRCGPVET